MTEKGSDELLAELGDMHKVMAPVITDSIELAEEEERVLASEPAPDEPGTDYPVADEVPEGEPEEYDTNPPETP
jgi:hypothetical protein